MSALRISIVIFLLTTALYFANAFRFAENALSDLRFEIIKTEPADSLVTISIDPKSIAEIGVWPWPRRFHASVLEKLIAAGAERVALDIDFSSASTPSDDLALEIALAKSQGKVILPVFKQQSLMPNGNRQVVTTAPLARFQRHAALASINVRPDADGMVRRLDRVELLNGRVLPVMATALTDQPISLDAGAFDIDYGIRLAKLRHISFVDVLAGRFDPRMILGKRIIVGATAVELGDQLAVPVHRSLPGVVVQGLGYESLIQGRALQRLPEIVTLILILGLSVLLVPRYSGMRWTSGLALAGVGSLGIFAAGIGVSALSPKIVEVAPLIFVAIAGYGASLVLQIDRQSLRLFVNAMSLRRQKALGDVILDTAGHAIVVIGHDSRISIFNPAAEELFGNSANEVIGQRFDELFVKDDGKFRGDILDPGLMIYDLGQPRELEAKRKDGTNLFVEVIVKPVEDAPSDHPLEKRKSTRTSYVCTLVDVTKRKHAELAEYTARIQAQSANRAKSTFLANMSHELRTPLNAVLGFSQLALSEKPGTLNDRQKEYLGSILSSGQHLLSLINDVLDLSKIESDRFELHKEMLDVQALIENSLRFVEHRAIEGQVTLDTRIDTDVVYAWGDERAIKQVLVNLLSNAVKFTPPGGKVNLAVGRNEEGELKIVVSDTGIGIRAEELETVLAPFGQARAGVPSNVEGTGLGLTLAKQLIEMHDGRLELRSQFGEGTEVMITLPQTDSPPEVSSAVH